MNKSCLVDFSTRRRLSVGNSVQRISKNGSVENKRSSSGQRILVRLSYEKLAKMDRTLAQKPCKASITRLSRPKVVHKRSKTYNTGFKLSPNKFRKSAMSRDMNREIKSDKREMKNQLKHFEDKEKVLSTAAFALDIKMPPLDKENRLHNIERQIDAIIDARTF